VQLRLLESLSASGRTAAYERRVGRVEKGGIPLRKRFITANMPSLASLAAFPRLRVALSRGTSSRAGHSEVCVNVGIEERERG
jgi:hypothetical protein